jgi:hypothetical protein
MHGLTERRGMRMPDHVDDLDRLIRQQTLKLEKLRAEVAKLEGELRGLNAARNLIARGMGAATTTLFQREISKEWREILTYFLRASPNPVSIGEVMQFIDSRGIQINRNAVRSQLHHYVNRGFLERIGEGLYRATDAVKPLCGD